MNGIINKKKATPPKNGGVVFKGIVLLGLLLGLFDGLSGAIEGQGFDDRIPETGDKLPHIVVHVGEILVDGATILGAGAGEVERGEKRGHLVALHNHLDAQVGVLRRSSADRGSGGEDHELVGVDLIDDVLEALLQPSHQLQGGAKGEELRVQLSQKFRRYGIALDGAFVGSHNRNTPFSMYFVVPYWALTI